MEDNVTITPLFPIPILNCSLPISLSNIIPWLDSQPMETPNPLGKGHYGTTSKNTYILDDDTCTEIRNFILEKALVLGKSLGYECTEYRMTQSWITHKKPTQSHHPHSHSNSILSGVFFYGSSFKSDCSAIIFHHPETRTQGQISIPKNPELAPTPYSSETNAYKPTPGDLIIFPSTLSHSVPENTTNEVRKSLAFNIIPKEGLGEKTALNQLKFN